VFRLRLPFVQPGVIFLRSGAVRQHLVPTRRVKVSQTSEEIYFYTRAFRVLDSISSYFVSDGKAKSAVFFNLITFF